jgi:hypothetical protein
MSKPCSHRAHLVQLFLPMFFPDGRRVARAQFDAVRRDLTRSFGGLTAYTRAPAEGWWERGTARPVRDDIIVVEVMTDKLNRAWWDRYRRELERRFRQQALLIRVMDLTLL